MVVQGLGPVLAVPEEVGHLPANTGVGINQIINTYLGSSSTTGCSMGLLKDLFLRGFAVVPSELMHSKTDTWLVLATSMESHS